MTSPPIWFIKTGTSQGTGVMVWVRDKQGNRMEKRLLTAQHVIRVDGAANYSNEISGWLTETGAHEDFSYQLEIDRILTPDFTPTMEESDDFAFLKIPSTVKGITPCAAFLEEAQFVIGLDRLKIVGFPHGADLTVIDGGVIRYVPYDNWKFERIDTTVGDGVLNNGNGHPAEGVSGGGVFQDKFLCGIYRGAYQKFRFHYFIPLRRISEECFSRGYDLCSSDLEQSVRAVKFGTQELADFQTNQEASGTISDSEKKLELLEAMLDQLRFYKRVHDGLHQLQIPYVGLSKTIQTFLEKADDLDNMDNYFNFLDSFQSPVKQVEEIVDDFSAIDQTVANQEKPWIEHLKTYLKEAEGLTVDSITAHGACIQIGSTIKNNMERINAILCNIPQSMNLSDLGSVFDQVGAISGILEDSSKAFVEAGKACLVLDAIVVELAENHNDWQNLDNQLWGAEKELLNIEDSGDGPFRFRFHLGGITAGLQNLSLNSPGNSWVEESRRNLAQLQESSESEEWNSAGLLFRQLARTLRKEFLEADKNLKTEAEKIAKIGEMIRPFLP